MEEERRRAQKGTLEAWKSWVKEAGLSNKGWAHSWTSLKDPWKPTRVRPGSQYAGRPLEVLQAERERLMAVWGCSQDMQPWFEAPEGCHSDLPPISLEAAIRVARSFPRRTAQTFDGFHPRHYAMLEADQLQVFLALAVHGSRRLDAERPPGDPREADPQA